MHQDKGFGGDRLDNYAETVPNTTIKLGANNREDVFTVSSEIGNGTSNSPYIISK